MDDKKGNNNSNVYYTLNYLGLEESTHVKNIVELSSACAELQECSEEIEELMEFLSNDEVLDVGITTA